MNDKKELVTNIIILSLSAILAFGLGWGIRSQLDSPQDSDTRAMVRLPDGRDIRIPKDNMARIRIEEPVDGGYNQRYYASGDSRGGYGRGTGTISANTSPSSFDLTDGAEKGFGGGIDAVAKGAQNGTNVIIFAGILFIVAGVVVLVFLKNIKVSIVCFAVGGALILTGLLVATYPWVLLVGFVAILGILAYFVYAMWKSGRLKTAFTKVVSAIENVDENTQAAVKAQISEEASSEKDSKTVKAEVTQVKQSL